MAKADVGMFASHPFLASDSPYGVEMALNVSVANSKKAPARLVSFKRAGMLATPASGKLRTAPTAKAKSVEASIVYVDERLGNVFELDQWDEATNCHKEMIPLWSAAQLSWGKPDIYSLSHPGESRTLSKLWRIGRRVGVLRLVRQVINGNGFPAAVRDISIAIGVILLFLAIVSFGLKLAPIGLSLGLSGIVTFLVSIAASDAAQLTKRRLSSCMLRL